MLPRNKKATILIRVSEEFKKQTEFMADTAGETISDYIRKAVEQRNGQYKQDEQIIYKEPIPKSEWTEEDHRRIDNLFPSRTNELKLPEGGFEDLAVPGKQPRITSAQLKPTIPGLKEEVKGMDGKPKMVQYLGKGEKK